MPSSGDVMRLLSGYRLSQALHVAATLELPDRVADGPRTVDELADATGTNRRALHRLLRALASLDVLNEQQDGSFALAPLGERLRKDAPDSLHGWAVFIGGPSHWQAWGNLLHTVRTGENAFRHVHGMSVWEYRAEHPEESAIFDAAMTSLTRAVDAAVIGAFDFSRFETVVDVGGGRGAFLSALLRAHPAMQGVLFDQPHVVAGAGELLADAGVADRCRVVAGSFFEDVPAGADAYVLKAIIHDWQDDESVAILRVCRRAMPAAASVLLVERELGPPNESPDAKLSDLNMLVAAGGQERTVDEFAALFEAAGLRLVGATPSGVGVSVIEARPVT